MSWLPAVKARPRLAQALLDQLGPEAWELRQEHHALLLGPRLALQQPRPTEPERCPSVEVRQQTFRTTAHNCTGQNYSTQLPPTAGLRPAETEPTLLAPPTTRLAVLPSGPLPLSFLDI